MGCNRKRGRPRKTKPAFNYQEEVEYVFSDTDSESEAPIEVVKTDRRKKKIDEYEQDDEAYDLPATWLITMQQLNHQHLKPHLNLQHLKHQLNHQLNHQHLKHHSQQLHHLNQYLKQNQLIFI